MAKKSAGRSANLGKWLHPAKMGAGKQAPKIPKLKNGSTLTTMGAATTANPKAKPAGSSAEKTGGAG